MQQFFKIELYNKMNAEIVTQKKWFRILPVILALIMCVLMFKTSPIFRPILGLLGVVGVSICNIAMKKALWPSKYFKEISIDKYMKIVLCASSGTVLIALFLWLLISLG